jgi:hypothetical protein
MKTGPIGNLSVLPHNSRRSRRYSRPRPLGPTLRAVYHRTTGVVDPIRISVHEAASVLPSEQEVGTYEARYPAGVINP